MVCDVEAQTMVKISTSDSGGAEDVPHISAIPRAGPSGRDPEALLGYDHAVIF